MEFTPQFYDEGWENGWDDMKLYGPTARHTRRFIFKMMEGLSFESLLDAGCGTGVLLEKIQSKYLFCVLILLRIFSTVLDKLQLVDAELLLILASF